MLSQQEVIEIYQSCGALMEGHFLLRSGLHSDKFLQSATILQYPQHTSLLCAELASRIKTDKKADFIIAPAIGGVLIAYEVAKNFNVRGIFAEKNGDSPMMKLRAGFQIKPNEKAIVVEDVYTTGGSIRRVIDIVKSYGAEVIAVGALVDRSQGKVEFEVPAYALAKVEFSEYKPEECPMCKRGIGLVEV